MTGIKTVISLGENLDVRHVTELKRTLDEAIHVEGDVCLDASKVKKADTAGLQLIYCFQKDRAATYGSARVINASEAVVKAISMCGLGTLIPLHE